MRKIILFSFISLFTMQAEAQTVRAGLNFDGNNDAVVIPDASSINLGTGTFTIEMWVQADESQAFNPHLLHKKDTLINATGFAVAIASSGKPVIELAGNSYGTGSGRNSGFDLADGNCHHIAFHRDLSGSADTVRIFMDGELVPKSVRAVPSADISYAADLFVGWTRGGFGREDFPFNGMIKELRIWNVVRSESQISDNMDKFIKGPVAGLVGNWRFNENSGNTVVDASPAKNNGTLLTGNGAPAWDEFCDVIDDSLPTGIAELSNDNVSSYPNPVIDVLNFKLEQSQNINELRIYNMLGKVVLNDNRIVNQVDVSSLSLGVYFYEIQLTDGSVATSKFVKQ